MKPELLTPLLIFFPFTLLQAQSHPLRQHPVSSHADTSGFLCQDSSRFILRKVAYDLGIVLPSWLPIAGNEYVATLEGIVDADSDDGGNGPIVSHEDLPFYHYSHDFTFNVIPDIMPDKRYELLLPRPEEKSDTLLRKTIHVEWECGLGSYNAVNPYSDIHNSGKSSGFYSAGHQRKDIIRHWPAPGDWVHVEGHYVWDRGHPPAKAEIHPARLIAVKRQLPSRRNHPVHGKVMCTRFDLFASGDGGALKNNRPDSSPIADKTPMSDRDYKIRFIHALAKGKPGSVLRYEIEKLPGDTYPGLLLTDQLNDSTILLRIPWKTENRPDDAVLARTIWLYWDEPIIPTSDSIETYTITFSHLRFDNRSEQTGKAEWRVFMNVGSEWVFLNEWYGGKKGNILRSGMGKTFRRKWPVPVAFEISLPKAKAFRVAVCGWEADGVDALTGEIFPFQAKCTEEAKAFFKRKVFNLNSISKGCADDNLGEISEWWTKNKIGSGGLFSDQVDSGLNIDPCPNSSWSLKGNLKISYKILPLYQKLISP